MSERNSFVTDAEDDRELEARAKSDAQTSMRRNRQRGIRRLDQLTPTSIVGIWDVAELTTLSRATIYRKMKAGTFPSNRQLNANRAGWRLADVLAWLENPR